MGHRIRDLSPARHASVDAVRHRFDRKKEYRILARPFALKSGTFSFQQYTIKTFNRGAAATARAYVGDKPTPVTAEAKTVDDAVRLVERQLHNRDADRRASREDGVPTAEEFADAFAALGPKVKKHHWRMLEAHLLATDSRMTAGEIAGAAGYSNYATANSLYGALGRLLAEHLDYGPPLDSDGSTLWTATLALGDRADPDKLNWRWTLRPEVVACLRALGIGSEPASTSAVRD
jgi:hypothetical protein